jgi:adenylate cyclase
MLDFIKELTRRKVWLFGGVYLALGWVLLQVAALLESTLNLPDWIDQSAFVLLLIGFPVALLLAWAQEARATPIADKVADASDVSPEQDFATDPDGESDLPSIAVLPMVNMSDDKEKEFFADGMTEDVITGLSKSKHLFVISRTSTFRYKGQSPDIRDVAKELGVRYVVEGSVRSVSDRVRITVQLIDAKSGGHVWAENYDRPADKLFDIQDEVIAAITSSLGAELRRAEVDRMRHLKPAKLSSWQAVQQAIMLGFRFDDLLGSSNWPGLQELRAACKNDPDYAYAHSVLAWCLSNMVVNGYSDSVREDYQEALSHLNKALALAGDDPLNLHYCAYAMGFMGRHEEGLKLCQRVTELDPNFIDVHVAYGIIYAYLGRYGEANEALNRVELLAPLGVNFQAYAWHRANLRSLEGRHSEAEEILRTVIQQWPHYACPYYFLAIALEAQGRIDEARAAVAKALEIYPKHSLKRIGGYLGTHPDPEEGKRRLEVLSALWPSTSGDSV